MTTQLALGAIYVRNGEAGQEVSGFSKWVEERRG
jgi:hypothetical protein